MIENDDENKKKENEINNNNNNNNNTTNNNINVENNNIEKKKLNKFKKKNVKSNSIDNSSTSNNISNNTIINYNNTIYNNTNISNNINTFLNSPTFSEKSFNSISSSTNKAFIKSDNSIINIENLFRDDISEPNSDYSDSSIGKYFSNNNNKNNGNGIYNKNDDDEIEQVPELVDYSEMIINILYPVCITMVIVVLAIRSISSSATHKSPPPMDFADDSGESEGGVGGADKMVFDSIVNSLIFLAVIILSTTIMVVLYKFKMMKALYAWLMGTSVLLLGVFGGFLFLILLAYLNLGLDYITFVIVVWNFSVGGIVCIFWYSPKLLNHSYLISISVLMALFFSRLPDWTTWAILSVVSIYDIFAVLCPGGPLKILIETAQKRNEEIPAMIYNASIYIGMVMVDNDNDNKGIPTCGSITPPPPVPNYIKQEKLQEQQLESQSSSPKQLQLTKSIIIGDETNEYTVSDVESSIDSTTSESIKRGKQSIRLGLGDFVFYSVLIGKAAVYQITTVFTVFIAIITGLFLTLILLAIFKKPLPALPMSIIFGIIVFFLTFKILIQFIFFLGENQIFV